MKEKVIIIAEAGVNHNGKLILAKRLAQYAKKAGADAVKFQTFDVDHLILKKTKTAVYQKRNLKNNISQYLMLKKYQLADSSHKELSRYSKKKKIKFLSTAFDEKSLRLLEKYKLDYIKIPSGEITNFPLIKFLAQNYKKIILSTGMSNTKEIEWTIKVLQKYKIKKKNIISQNN